MSAIVTDDRDEDWYTNGRGWSIITERVMKDLDPAQVETFETYASTIGLNFGRIEQPTRGEVARWVLRAVETLAGPEAAEHGWDTDNSRNHLGELVVMLRAMA
ncbi:hypothetical protein GCM10010172_36210 [Paractinoplanes ferrugineus]|uniref:Uncharacterized protein n=1 Tax=Paractinoplanes ferrugineus TaxID=113564 RepID=A0A919IWQ0_9ACTN|nr:hypothetical protein [Actinoplanes ferrugineus]GIE09217.1 hypothetical protein Afe05nite_10570 [Actinoplanes ferrugineus]